MGIERRTVLKGSAAVAGGALVGGPFQGLVAAPANAMEKPTYRGLKPVADLRDGKVRLHLPDGFNYRSFHDTESPVVLDDGTRLPGRHDGMGAFATDSDNVRLVRNHEVNGSGVGRAFGPVGDHTYDPNAQGGCTVVEVTKQGEVIASWTGLNGTMMNCSGGPMPWGAWITCEETVNGPDVGPDFTRASNIPLTKPHGYIFEVPSAGHSSGEPITKAGRFAHESVALDPVDGYLYLTEDNFAFPSGFYRYKPAQHPMQAGRIDNEGTLQMLAVKGQPEAHLEAEQAAGTTYAVEWVDIADPDPTFPYTPGEQAPTSNDTALTYVGNQGRVQGAAHFSRLEGAIHDDGVIFFTATQGGGVAETGPDSAKGYGNGCGQVWAYDCRTSELRVVFQSPSKLTLDLPDNITVSPRGTLVVCEDNIEDNYVRGLSKDGRIWDIALNRVQRARDGAPRYDDEFAGSTFSPDGHTLFVNIQAGAGMTFAIWGPWRTLGV